MHQKSLAHGGAQGIHHNDLPLGVFLHHQLRGNLCGVTGAGKAGGKRNVQKILTLLCKRAEQRCGILGIGGGGGGQRTGPEFVVKDLIIHGAGAVVGLALDGEAQGQDGDIVSLAVGQRQVSAAVGGNAEVHRCKSPFLSRLWIKAVQIPCGPRQKCWCRGSRWR